MGDARESGAMRRFVRAVGLRGATAINVITMVGIGPLITIPLVLGALHGPLSLAGWILGALLSLCDGLVWAELGSLYPHSGGTYGFLLESFGRARAGRLLAFLFVWQTVCTVPLTLASGYIGFANYAGYLFPGLGASPMRWAWPALGMHVDALIRSWPSPSALSRSRPWYQRDRVELLGSASGSPQRRFRRCWR